MRTEKSILQAAERVLGDFQTDLEGSGVHARGPRLKQMGSGGSYESEVVIELYRGPALDDVLEFHVIRWAEPILTAAAESWLHEQLAGIVGASGPKPDRG
jgi:hypothetical protein